MSSHRPYDSSKLPLFNISELICSRNSVSVFHSFFRTGCVLFSDFLRHHRQMKIFFSFLFLLTLSQVWLMQAYIVKFSFRYFRSLPQTCKLTMLLSGCSMRNTLFEIGLHLDGMCLLLFHQLYVVIASLLLLFDLSLFYSNSFTFMF